MVITYNSHRVLKLLLERLEEFGIYPRLRGPNLLEITALYADVEIVMLLVETDHLKLKYITKTLSSRTDVTDELILAFDDFLFALGANIGEPKSIENLTGGGLFKSTSSGFANMC